MLFGEGKGPTRRSFIKSIIVVASSPFSETTKVVSAALPSPSLAIPSIQGFTCAVGLTNAIHGASGVFGAGEFFRPGATLLQVGSRIFSSLSAIQQSDWAGFSQMSSACGSQAISPFAYSRRGIFGKLGGVSAGAFRSSSQVTGLVTPSSAFETPALQAIFSDMQAYMSQVLRAMGQSQQFRRWPLGAGAQSSETFLREIVSAVTEGNWSRLQGGNTLGLVCKHAHLLSQRLQYGPHVPLDLLQELQRSRFQLRNKGVQIDKLDSELCQGSKFEIAHCTSAIASRLSRIREQANQEILNGKRIGQPLLCFLRGDFLEIRLLIDSLPKSSTEALRKEAAELLRIISGRRDRDCYLGGKMSF
jgi:hypothetical protein